MPKVVKKCVLCSMPLTSMSKCSCSDKECKYCCECKPAKKAKKAAKKRK